MKETAATHPGKRIEVWFQDEARIGQQGTVCRVWAETGSRPRATKQTNYKWVYLFGAVCPGSGATHGWLMPYANTWVMNLYLHDFSKHLPPDVHALLVMDGAGWHNPKALEIPANVSILLLPPYSPELNPSELMWREMRQKKLSNLVHLTEADLWTAVENAWLWLTNDPERTRSLCAFPWIISATNNLN